MGYERWKKEAECYGWRIVGELDSPKDYEVYVNGDNVGKHLRIYEKQSCDCKVSFTAPTYYDLFQAVRDAWLAHQMMQRGF